VQCKKNSWHDDEDNNDEDDNDREDDKHVPNGDDISNSGFLNGSYDEPHIHTDHNKEKGNQETNWQITASKPLYDVELEEYGRSDAVALDMQFIKGVLPDLFDILKFLESDDDLVFNGTICHYFFKNCRLLRVNIMNCGKRNSITVRKKLMEGMLP